MRDFAANFSGIIRTVKPKSRVGLHLAEKVTEGVWSDKTRFPYYYERNRLAGRTRDVLPPLAARLVRWMAATAPDAGAGSDEIAAQLANAWRELFDARGVALWALSENGRLEPLGRAGEFDGQLAPDAHIEFAQSAWPQHPFWVAHGQRRRARSGHDAGNALRNDRRARVVRAAGRVRAGAIVARNRGRIVSTRRGKTRSNRWPRKSGALLDNALRVEKLGRSFHQLARRDGRRHRRARNAPRRLLDRRGLLRRASSGAR